MKTTKKLMTLLLAMSLMGGIVAQAQEGTERSLSLELFGAQNTVGINYDSRFKGNHGLGYRVGVGYGYSETSTIASTSYALQGIAAPIEINYLFGKGRHKLELGIGTSLGYYYEKCHVLTTVGPAPGYGGVYGGPPYFGYADYYKKVTHNTFGYFVFGNIGYRLQTNRGFQFRAGMTPSFNFGDQYGIHRKWYYPYVSFGWRL
jgi:hypothetical protein